MDHHDDGLDGSPAGPGARRGRGGSHRAGRSRRDWQPGGPWASWAPDRSGSHGPPWTAWHDSPGRKRVHRPPRLVVPILVAVIVAMWTAGEWGGHDLVGDRDPDALAYGLLLTACAVLVVRRRQPAVAVAATTAIAIGYPMLGYPTTGAFVLPMVVALYAAMARDRRRWAAAGATVYLVSFLFMAVIPQAVQPEAVLIVPVWVLGALVAGEGARNRRAFFAEARRRARESERSRAEEDRRRESEERVRIAREVHDVVSHSIAMINVQAGVAAHLLDDDPEQARTALIAIKEASRDALRDLRATLGVLRAVDDDAVGEDGRAPTPGLSRLDELAERLEAAGLDVEVTTTGIDGPLPAGVDLAAYRIVQEAVSNVLRHAAATTVKIDVRRERDELRVAVTDDGRGDGRAVPAPASSPLVPGSDRGLARLGRRQSPVVEGAEAVTDPPPEGRNGLRGMRERATALGGRVEAGPRAEGGWEVVATLPVTGPQRVTPRGGGGS